MVSRGCPRKQGLVLMVWVTLCPLLAAGVHVGGGEWGGTGVTGFNAFRDKTPLGKTPLPIAKTLMQWCPNGGSGPTGGSLVDFRRVAKHPKQLY